MAINKLMDWMTILSGQGKYYREENIAICVHGEEDDSYVVIERDLSYAPIITEQYTITPSKNHNNLYAFITFLAECGFSLETLVSKLARASYCEENRCSFGGIEVSRYMIEGSLASNMRAV